MLSLCWSSQTSSLKHPGPYAFLCGISSVTVSIYPALRLDMDYSEHNCVTYTFHFQAFVCIEADCLGKKTKNNTQSRIKPVSLHLIHSEFCSKNQ